MKSNILNAICCRGLALVVWMNGFKGPNTGVKIMRRLYFPANKFTSQGHMYGEWLSPLCDKRISEKPNIYPNSFNPTQWSKQQNIYRDIEHNLTMTHSLTETQTKIKTYGRTNMQDSGLETSHKGEVSMCLD